MTRSLFPKAPDPIDPQAVRRDLEEVLAGDLRFDRLTRGIYASDASVYQIVPMGVVLPKTQQDVLETLAVCARWRVPLTARGGGTSQTGQCLGPGVVLDFSRHFTNILEINVAEKWARVEPGVVVDDLNRAVKPHGLQFALDISTSNRATIGGVIANNASDPHPLVRGKTLDHVLGLKVLLADGSIIVTGPLGDAEVIERCQLPSLEGACYRTVRRLAQKHADEIERRFPRILRSVGGYNLDRFIPARSASDGSSGGRGPVACAPGWFNLSDIFVGSKGTLGITLDATVRLVDLAAKSEAETCTFGEDAPEPPHVDTEKMFGPVLNEAFRELKRTFDPDNVLNPGKIVDAEPMTANLRFGPRHVTPDLPTTFDFSAEAGLIRAAEQCSGNGECRKRHQGIMCPSYQATGEEQHCTRGRANVLRLALTGQMELQGLTDRAVKEVLDLCLECKACKSECPNHLDMARMKAEFLHQFNHKHGLPWRNWLFGNVGELYKRGSYVRWLFGFLTRSRLGRLMNELLFGIDRRRVPPALAERSWSQQQVFDYFYDPLPYDPSSFPRQVLLFPDTFMNYCEPELGYRVQELLAKLECGTVAPGREEVGGDRLTCCGRPYISNGMLDQAVTAARHNVERLYPWAVQGEKIIACEPSCILTIKDEYPALLRGEWREKAKTVAAACRTFEEFVLGTWDESLRLANAKRKRILVQAHCHQRALVGVDPLLQLLRRIPGAEVIDLDAGCCGMAGSFGYEKEHYGISRLVGEQRLFPALRKLAGDSIVVAPGFSCRQQIEHFTGIRAVHPAQMLCDLLQP